MNAQIKNAYDLWLEKASFDASLIQELQEVSGDEEAINDRFYKDLEFGTGGLRGVIGAGSNRLNVYTVAKATRGYGRYLLSKFKNPSIAIAYDSRNKSDVFAFTAAGVMADMGIKVHIWKELMPTPALSFAVRSLGCSGGIVITASHNPAKYNGYKAYGPDGCQIANEAADAILAEIAGVNMFEDFRLMSYEEGIDKGLIQVIGEDLFDAYIAAVSKESVLGKDIAKDVKIAYTPLYGAGLRSVTTCLERNGFSNVVVVEEQAKPNGNFPTCPYPNPEIREALEVGLKVAKEEGADLLMATDPDCDRVGIAVREGDDYRLFSGNEVGILLLDYICKRRIANGTMPERAIAIKTIVSTDLAGRIAADYGIQVIDVLTGFKFIGEQIALLEAKGEENRYILGFEESYGYLSGTYVRDKDAVNASLMIADMFAYYKSEGKSLIEVLHALYEKYGYCLNTLYSFEFEGESGMKKMENLMETVRTSAPAKFDDKAVIAYEDYKLSKSLDILSGVSTEIKLPKSNVIKLRLEGNSSVVFRPSGTEPKLKIYLSINAANMEEARKTEQKIVAAAKKELGL